MTTTSPSTSARASQIAEPQNLDARNRVVIAVLMISVFVMILNETILGVALPRLSADLHVEPNVAQWLTAAFLLTMAVVIPITGFLLQRFNTRPVFIAALSLFSLGTLVAALAPGFDLLLVARVIQASGTAIMFPLLMTTVMNLVPVEHRGRMMGNISIVISVAPAIGPTISGLILNALPWRFLFLLVLPIAIAALVIGAVMMKNVTDPIHTKIDILSIVLSAVGFGGLVFGLSTAGTATSALQIWAPLGIGSIALVAFVLRQLVLQRTDRALLDLRTFRSRTFTLSVATFSIAMLSMFGVIVLLPFYLVRVLHTDVLEVGLLLLPGGLIMGLLSPVVGRIYDRFGPTVLLVIGSILVSADLWAMTMLTEHSSVFWVLAAHVTLSIGLALLFTPLFTASLGSVEPSLYSHGSAIVATTQQVAGAAGTALFVTIMSARVATLTSEGATLGSATAAGIHSAFIVGAIISLFAIPAAFFIRKNTNAEPTSLGH